MVRTSMQDELGRFTVTKWTDEPWDWQAANSWAKQNCPSFIQLGYIDMSDISSWSGEADTGYSFYFEAEEDAFQFSLRWL